MSSLASTSLPAAAAAIPTMSYPNCATFPPPSATDSATTWWNETAAPLQVCSSGNTSYVAACCASVGGEARAVCERVMCLTDAAEAYFDCVGEAREQSNDTESLVGTCTKAEATEGGNSSSPAVRPVAAVLVLSLLSVAL